MQAFREKADQLRAAKMRIFVRRGGPNYKVRRSAARCSPLRMSGCRTAATRRSSAGCACVAG